MLIQFFYNIMHYCRSDGYYFYNWYLPWFANNCKDHRSIHITMKWLAFFRAAFIAPINASGVYIGPDLSFLLTSLSI